MNWEGLFINQCVFQRMWGQTVNWMSYLSGGPLKEYPLYYSLHFIWRISVSERVAISPSSYMCVPTWHWYHYTEPLLLIKVWLIYNVLSSSVVQQSDPVIRSSCVVQWGHFAHPFHSHPFPHWEPQVCSSRPWSVSVFLDRIIWSIF